MPFLTVDDYKAQIKDNVLLQIIENDTATREIAEQAAEAEMVSYLNSRYDTTAIFAAISTDRSAIIIMKMVDLVLYHLHSRISPDQVPDLRKERYDAAINWLNKVSKQQVNPDLPVDEDDPIEEIVWGSNSKRNHHF